MTAVAVDPAATRPAPERARPGPTVPAIEPVEPVSPDPRPVSHLWLLGWSFVASLGAVVITPAGSSLPVWWPATFVGVGLLLRAPRHRWFALVVLLLVVVSAGQVAGQRQPVLAVALGLSTALVALATAAVLQRTGTQEVRDLRALVALLVAVGVGVLVLAVCLAPLVLLTPGASYMGLLSHSTLSHLTAALCLGPLFLTTRTPGGRASREQVAQWGLLLALEFWVFVTPTGTGMAVALLPVLLWGAVRQSTRAAAIQSLTVAALAVLLFSAGRGPFTVGPDQPYVDWTAATSALQLFLAAMALTVLVVAVAGEQQRDAVRAARDESDFTRTVLATTDALTIVVDGTGRIELVNGAAERATGYDSAELVGALLWETLVPPEHRAAVRSVFHVDDGTDLLRLRLRERQERELVTRDGRLLRVQVSASPLLRGPGGRSSVVLTAIDVTSERRTGGLLRRMLQASSGTATIGVGPDGLITVFSRGAEELLGIDASDALGAAFTRLVASGRCDGSIEVDAGADPGAELRRLHQACAPGSADDWWWRCADGGAVAVSQTLDAVHDGSGRVTDYLVTARDETEQRRTQEVLVAALGREREAAERLRTLDVAKNDFVTTVSHELRTPTSNVVGYAEMLRDAVQDEELEHLVDAVVRNGNRLRVLADDLVTLSDLELQQPREAGPFDLRAELRSVVAEQAEVARERGQRIELVDQLPGDSPFTLDGDVGHVGRAIGNVVDNAAKFSPADSTIEVRLTCSGDVARVRVSDRGMGIPPGEVDLVLGRFYRARNAHEQAVQGSGLGLSLAETVVRMHGGCLTLSSDEGGGTEVDLTFPRVDPIRSGSRPTGSPSATR